MAIKKTLLLCFLPILLLGGGIYLYLYGNNAIFQIADTGQIVCTDGVFVYNLSAKLITPNGNPLKETKIIAFSNAKIKPSEIEDSSETFATTDSQGQIELTVFSGLSWGGVYRPGIDSPPQPPVPNNPKVLYLWHEDTDGQWRQTEIVIEDSAIKKSQRGRLHIHIEQIQVNDNKFYEPAAAGVKGKGL